MGGLNRRFWRYVLIECSLRGWGENRVGLESVNESGDSNKIWSVKNVRSALVRHFSFWLHPLMMQMFVLGVREQISVTSILTRTFDFAKYLPLPFGQG